jgi:hypothetical protein
MITVPSWMFWSLVAINVLMGMGWGWTIGWSMNRALTMYEFGRTTGFEQGKLSVGPQRKSKRKR